MRIEIGIAPSPAELSVPGAGYGAGIEVDGRAIFGPAGDLMHRLVEGIVGPVPPLHDLNMLQQASGIFRCARIRECLHDERRGHTDVGRVREGASHGNTEFVAQFGQIAPFTEVRRQVPAGEKAGADAGAAGGKGFASSKGIKDGFSGILFRPDARKPAGVSGEIPADPRGAVSACEAFARCIVHRGAPLRASPR